MALFLVIGQAVDGPGDECLYMDPRVKKENIQQVFEVSH